MLAATAKAADPMRTTEAPTPERAGPCKFTLVSNRAEFDALESDWNDLFDRVGRGTQIFQTFNWCWHWCNHYQKAASGEHPDETLAIVTGRRDGRLVLVCPFVIKQVAGLRQLNWLGAPVSQYGDILIEDGPDAHDLLREAWGFVRTEIAPDVARFRKVREDAAIMPLLGELKARSIDQLEAPYLDLSGAKNFAAYEQRYSPRSRRNRKRLGRRLEERGTMVFEHLTGGARAKEVAKLAIAMKRTWLKDRGLVSPAFADPRMDGFFEAVAEAASHPVGCVTSTLLSGDEVTAIEIAFHAKDRIVMHVIVFNLEYEKAGAGVLLLEKTISDSFGDGCATFDLLAPADGYKLDWADATAAVNDWVLPLSLKGWAYTHLYLGFVRQSAKAVLAAMPKELRRTVAARFLSSGEKPAKTEAD